MAIGAPPNVESDYRLLREGAGMLDVGARGHVRVTGPQAREYLQGQVTNDVLALEPGQGCYAALLNPKGRLLTDMRLLVRESDDVWLDCEEGALEALLENLRMYKIGRDVEVSDVSSERSILALIGPAAADQAGLERPAVEHSSIEVEVGGARVVAVTTALGVDLMTAAKEAGSVRSALADSGVQAVGAEAAEVLRIESGTPRYGVDMTTDNLPGEVGLDRSAVSFTKGCYVGQEPVARMYHRGHPNRHLRGVRLARPASMASSLFYGEREVGSITSACVSPALGPIALAIVRREVEPGATVGVGEGREPAAVVELPFERP